MTRFWKELEGVSIAESYRLERCLGTEHDSAFFALTADPDPDRPKTVMKLMHAESAGAEEQLAAWHATRELSHPHLMALLDCGETDVAGGPWIYAVFEHPDDSLASAIASGSLGEQDAEAVCSAIGDSLRYVHENGLAHGAVDPDHVVAVGDRIKLTSDTLRNSGEEAAAADLRGLKELHAKLVPAAAVVQEPESPPKTAVVAAAAAPAPPDPAFAEAAREVGDRAPKLMLAGALAALLVAIVLAATQRSAPVAQTPAAPSAAAPAPAPAPAEPAKAAHVQPVSQQVPSLQHERWRVVAYTYNHRGQAEKKAQTVNRKWPGFEASVFAPRGAGAPPYFVALGGPMSRERAAAVQRRARARGLPRDTFIRTYSN